jgi:hypothetical protein
MMKYHLTTILFLLFSTTSLFCYNSGIDTPLTFKGINSKLAYVRGRQLNEAYFVIVNKSNKKVKVIISKGELIRGNSTDPLTELLIKDNQFPNGNSYIYLNPNTEKKVRIKFNPVDLYEGSTYTIRATITVEDKEYVASSVIALFRQAVGDKNKYKK